MKEKTATVAAVLIRGQSEADKPISQKPCLQSCITTTKKDNLKKKNSNRFCRDIFKTSIIFYDVKNKAI
jgi:hypothetical protein